MNNPEVGKAIALVEEIEADPEVQGRHRYGAEGSENSNTGD